jgi:hypothetical protein
MEWSTAISAVAAFITGAGLALAYMTRRDQISVNLFFAYKSPVDGGSKPWSPISRDDLPQVIEIKCTVNNRSSHTIALDRIEAAGIPFTYARPDGVTYLTVDHEIASGGEHTVSFEVSPDWVSLQSQFDGGVRNPSLRASAIIDCRRRMYRHTSRTAHKIVPEETIRKNAVTASQN